MKKVLIVSGSLPPIKCGVGYYTKRLLEELPTKELDIEILSTSGVDSLPGRKLNVLKNWRLTSLFKIKRSVERSGADIVHIQYPAVGYSRQLGINFLPYALRLSKQTLIVTLHEYHESRLVGKIRDLITIFPAHKIILSNEQDRQALPRFLRKKVLIIPIGPNIKKAPADPDFYKSLLKKNGLSTTKPTLLYFGFAHPNKNLEALIGAMTERNLADYQLLLLCNLDQNDAYQARLSDQINSVNNGAKRIAVTGFLSDEQVSEALQAGKYFVLPQRSPLSAKSSTAITAVTHGLILVSAGSNNPIETLPFIDQQNSRLVVGVDSQTLARTIAQLEDSAQLQKAIKKGSLELAEYFSWSNIIKGHLKLYE